MPVSDATAPDPELSALADELRDSLAPGIQLLEAIGAGGMGHVFLGRDPLLKRQVAIKVLSPALANDPTARARFVREAEASAAVSHPNVVGIHLVGELPRSKTPYFVMQYIEGRSLADEITARSSMSEPRARRIVGEVASALAAAHARGLVHRDIKPANIMIEAETERPVVLDFGISAILQRAQVKVESKLTQAGTYLGTPTYMSPEQATGEPITEKSDVYSLGAVAFELLAGRPPFQGRSLVVMAAHLKDIAPAMHSVRPDIDAHFADLVDRCLAKEPAQRPTAAEIRQSLLPGSETVVEWPPPGLEPLRGEGARVARTWAYLWVAVLAFFLALGMQPTLASPRWSEGETSTFWSQVMTPSAAMIDEQRYDYRWGSDPTAKLDAGPLWLFLLGGLLAVAGALVSVVIVHTDRLFRKALRARRSGYPLSTIVEVGWDTGDVGALLSASGRFALLSPNARSAIRRLQLLRTLVTVLVPLVSLLVALGWISGLFGSRSQVPLIDGLDFAILLAPTLAGLIALWYLDHQGSLLSGLDTRARRRRAANPTDPRLVSSWLATAGLASDHGNSRASRARVWTARAFVPVGLLALGYGALMLFLTVFIAAALTTRGRGDAQRWMAAQESDSTRPMRWAEFDSIVALSALRAGPAVDSAAARLLLTGAVMAGNSAHAVTFNLDTASARAIGAMVGPGAVKILPVTIAIGRRLPLTKEQVAALDLASVSPWLPIWRRLARSGPLPPFWMFREKLPGVTHTWNIPIVPYGKFREPGLWNAAAGYRALLRGNVVEAELRARENIAAGRRLMDGATYIDELVGVSAVRLAAGLLARIAERSGNARLNDEASRLTAALQRRRSERLAFPAWSALFADPLEPDGLIYLKDQPTSTYAELSVVMSATYCLNAREILFGVHPGRRSLLDSIAAMSGTPRMSKLTGMTKRWYDEMELPDAMSLFRRDRRKHPGLIPLRWFGLTAFQNRLSNCLWSRGIS